MHEDSQLVQQHCEIPQQEQSWQQQQQQPHLELPWQQQPQQQQAHGDQQQAAPLSLAEAGAPQSGVHRFSAFAREFCAKHHEKSPFNSYDHVSKISEAIGSSSERAALDRLVVTIPLSCCPAMADYEITHNKQKVHGVKGLEVRIFQTFQTFQAHLCTGCD
jgi:hypothetical protein